MHVLVLPKWYPARPDPQLGDFIRKQMLAVAQRHRVSMVYPCPDPHASTKHEHVLDESDGMWELRCYYQPHPARFLPQRKGANFIRYREALESGIERLEKERGRPDLIHAHILTRPVMAAWWLARKWNIPFVVSEQSSVHLNGTWQRKNPAAKYFDQFLLRQAALSTAVSPHLAEALEKAGLGHDHAVVPNVIPGMDRPLPPAGPASRFMMVADLVDAVKNVSGVLRALTQARKAGHDFRLEVIGDGPDRAMLEALARKLGLDGQVTWLGRLPQAEVQPMMDRAGTVIVNSPFETFSVVTGEALACGKPVIATRSGGPEAFVTEANGILIPVGDDAVLTEAMITMYRMHGHFDPARVRSTVSDRFSEEAVAADFDAVYQQALKPHR